MQILALKALDPSLFIPSATGFNFFRRIPNCEELRTIFGEPSSRELLWVQVRHSASKEATVNRKRDATIRRPYYATQVRMQTLPWMVETEPGT